jgi:hypothetical protein
MDVIICRIKYDRCSLKFNVLANHIYHNTFFMSTPQVNFPKTIIDDLSIYKQK